MADSPERRGSAARRSTHQTSIRTASNVYDTFERLVAAKTSSSAGGSTAASPEAYCYDALDRRDRRITGLTGADDPTSGSGDALARARAACTKTTSSLGGGVEALEMSYTGLSKRLTTDQRTKDRTENYEYTAAGNRLGRTARTTGSPTPTWRSFETDAQGTVVGLEAPSTGKVPDSDRYDTDPYGAPVDATQNDTSPEATDNPFRYQGFYRDGATGTYDMEARAYRPALGQFLQRDRFADPTGDLALATDPLTASRYAFTAGNPSTRIEYDGHLPCRTAVVQGSVNCKAVNRTVNAAKAACGRQCAATAVRRMNSEASVAQATHTRSSDAYVPKTAPIVRAAIVRAALAGPAEPLTPRKPSGLAGLVTTVSRGLGSLGGALYSMSDLRCPLARPNCDTSRDRENGAAFGESAARTLVGGSDVDIIAGLIPTAKLAKLLKFGDEALRGKAAIVRELEDQGEVVVPTSRAARRAAMRQRNIPTSRSAKAQRGDAEHRQYDYDNGTLRDDVVTRHGADDSHALPHWEAGKSHPKNAMNKYGNRKFSKPKGRVFYLGD